MVASASIFDESKGTDFTAYTETFNYFANIIATKMAAFKVQYSILASKYTTDINISTLCVTKKRTKKILYI